MARTLPETRTRDRPNPSPGFVGRSFELDTLDAAVNGARLGSGRLIVVSGEAGIGKTTLADELTRRCVAAGVATCWGQCWEAGGAPPFWPWVQILRAIVRETPRPPGALARLLPELRAAGRPAADSDPERSRFRLFDEVGAFFQSQAEKCPMLVVLDDVHAADLPSLMLLRFLGPSARNSGLLIVATARDADPAAGESAAVLEEITRSAERITLGPLTGEEVRALVERRLPAAASPALLSAIVRKTEGHPLFVDEILRLLAMGPQADSPGSSVEPAIPPRLREAIRRHTLGVAAESVGRLLRVAAVIGREFDLDVLERVAAIDRQAALRLVGDAAAARLADPAGTAIARYRFVHALVREVLYDEIPIAERGPLHAAVARAIEQSAPDAARSRAAEIAHHDFEAARYGGDPASAVHSCREAAIRARDVLAFEEAVMQGRRALDALSRCGPDEPVQCDLLLELGEALRCAGKRTEAREIHARAAAIARTNGLAEAFTRAAVGYCGRTDLAASPDPRMLGLLEEALTMLDEGDSVLRASVLARLAVNLYFTDAHERREKLGREALAMAERLGDRRVLAEALHARHYSLWGPDHLEERLRTAARLIEIASESGDDEAACIGYGWRYIDRLEQGDLEGVDRDLDAAGRLAEATGQVFYGSLVASGRAMRAMVDGRLADAEALAMEGLALGEKGGTPNLLIRSAAQLFLLRRAQGRTAEMEPLLTTALERFPGIPALRATVALAHLDAGRLEEAKLPLARLASDGFASLPRDSTWLAALAALAEVAAGVDDAGTAETLYALLAPYADRFVVVSFGHACEGVVSMSLGLLATTLSRFDDAERHFRDARSRHAAIGAPLLLARANVGEAKMRLRRRAPGDREKALELLDAAGEHARSRGSAGIAAAVASLRAAATAADAAPEGGPLRIRCEGDFWSVDFAGRRHRVKQMKGLVYLELLLSHPGTEFHAIDLSRRTASVDAGTDPPPLGGDAGPVLDPRAIGEYRRRLRELEDELEESRARNDPGTSERIHAEIDAVRDALSGGLGLGGRNRRAASPVERARVAITKNLHSAIARLRQLDPDLGRHLERSVLTGTFFSYRPTALSRPT